MHAWRGHAYGPPESLRWEEVAEAELLDGQVRIKVRASAVNFPDVLFVAGTYQVKPEPPFIPGFEVSGTVLESRVTALPVGTRVSSTLDGSGGYATRAVGSLHNTFAIPPSLPFDDAGFGFFAAACEQDDVLPGRRDRAPAHTSPGQLEPTASNAPVTRCTK